MSINQILTGSSGKRDVAYAIGGMFLGVMAPLGWICLRLMLFWDDGSPLIEQVVGDIMSSAQSQYMYAYMCVGTMMVLGSFVLALGVMVVLALTGNLPEPPA